MRRLLVTVVEHPNYIKRAERLLSDDQMDEIANLLAISPDAGELIRGTGGFRKLRYAGIKGKGKSGGMRIIHYFVANHGEVHLVDIYAKGEQENLSKAECNELAKLAVILKGA